MISSVQKSLRVEEVAPFQGEMKLFSDCITTSVCFLCQSSCRALLGRLLNLI